MLNSCLDVPQYPHADPVLNTLITMERLSLQEKAHLELERTDLSVAKKELLRHTLIAQGGRIQNFLQPNGCSCSAAIAAFMRKMQSL